MWHPKIVCVSPTSTVIELFNMKTPCNTLYNFYVVSFGISDADICVQCTVYMIVCYLCTKNGIITPANKNPVATNWTNLLWITLLFYKIKSHVYMRIAY